MKHPARKKVIVVLGMHRSGTSAITKGLQALGVDLGDRLMPPAPDNNAKGFFEDEDIVHFNDEVLASIGLSWSSLADIPPATFADSKFDDFRRRAVDLVMSRAGDRLYGFKDPRMSKLLPFWNDVFERASVDVAYVIAVRNPMSIVESLGRRDSFLREKSYYLWMSYMLSALIHSQGYSRIAINFDQLMLDPKKQLSRIGHFLGVLFDENSEMAHEYAEDFLDPTLRHTHFSINDLRKDGGAPEYAATLMELLTDVSEDTVDLDCPEVVNKVSWVYDRLLGMEPALEYMDGADRRIEILRLEIEKLTRHIQELALQNESNAKELHDLNELKNKEVSDLNDYLTSVRGQVTDLESQISALVNSKSWKLISQLRKFRPYLSSWKNFISGVAKAVRRIAASRGEVSADQSHNCDADKVYAEEFDSELYLSLYPDVLAAGVDPAEHFHSTGRSEGRIGSFPKINRGALPANISERETVLVVGHEASLTGAPILTLNIVEHLRTRYNVIALLFGSGPLIPSFKDKCAMVIEAGYARTYSIVAERIIANICEAVDLKFAIVNSVEARAALPGLEKLGVPSLFLAHEFAADTFPKGSFRAAIRHADATIFSTNITYQNLLSTHPDIAGTPVHIIPQGQCEIPFLGNHEVSGSSERERVSAAIFGKGESEKKFTVLGAGSVCYRKGVDLFVSCALRAKQLCVDVDFRFVWIGKGFLPESDQFSAFLADQIERSGLKDDLVIIDETTEISFAYENADVFLLTSRLDPLPNVAIYVMGFGSPVLCFDKTTGVVDFLQKSGVASECVSPYLDVEDMANKLAHLARTQSARDKIAQSFLPCWRETFDFDKYISRLMNVYESIESRVSTRQADMAVIRDSGLYVMEFSDPEGIGCRSVDESIDRYLRTWEKDFEFETRKPFPGFHPGVFAERIPRSLEGDPCAEYIRSGMPEGAWLTPVIRAKGKEVSQWTLPSPSQVALHIHAYYPDLLPQILSALMCNRIRPDLFISVPSEIAKVAVYRHVQHYTEGKVVIEVVPNKGRDIGPFFSAFADSLREYEFIGHLHTKRSLHVSDSSIVERWFDFLISNLLGDAEHLMLDSILDTFVRDEQLGLVFPDDPNACGWTFNRKIAEELAPRLGIGALPSSFNFPIGTMFWARTRALAPFFDLGLDWADYPEEPLPIDGTMLHAIERLLPLGLAAPYQKVAVTHVPGVTR